MKTLKVLKEIILQNKNHEIIPTLHYSLGHFSVEYLEDLKRKIIETDKPIYFEAPLPAYSINCNQLDVWLHQLAIDNNKKVCYFETIEKQIQLYNSLLPEMNRKATLESVEHLERLNLNSARKLSEGIDYELVSSEYNNKLEELIKQYEYVGLVKRLTERDKNWKEPFISSMIIMGISHYFIFKKN